MSFDTLVHSLEDGMFVYESSGGEFLYLNSFTDPLWTELESLVQHIIGRAITDTEDAALFHQLLPHTIDAPSTGEKLASAWEKRPCPGCGSTQRSRFGPYVPPRFTSVEVTPATRQCWSALTTTEKHDLAARVLSQRDSS